MIHAMIIEDDVANHQYLNAMLAKHFPEVNVLATIEEIPIAIEKVKEIKPQLIFLDVELPPFTGFNLLEETQGLDYHVIFTTHFNKYAAKAFKYAAVHYLEKPFGKDDLKEAMDFYKERVGYSEEEGKVTKIDELNNKAVDVMLHNLSASEENQIIGFPVLGGIDFYPVKDIIWCKAEGVYADLRMTQDRKITVTKTLKKVELLLNDHNFFRVHNSYLINLDHMRKYLRGDGGEVVMSDGYEVDVARNRKDNFLEQLKTQGLI